MARFKNFRTPKAAPYPALDWNTMTFKYQTTPATDRSAQGFGLRARNVLGGVRYDQLSQPSRYNTTVPSMKYTALGMGMKGLYGFSVASRLDDPELVQSALIPAAFISGINKGVQKFAINPGVRAMAKQGMFGLSMVPGEDGKLYSSKRFKAPFTFGRAFAALDMTIQGYRGFGSEDPEAARVGRANMMATGVGWGVGTVGGMGAGAIAAGLGLSSTGVGAAVGIPLALAGGIMTHRAMMQAQITPSQHQVINQRLNTQKLIDTLSFNQGNRLNQKLTWGQNIVAGAASSLDLVMGASSPTLVRLREMAGTANTGTAKNIFNTAFLNAKGGIGEFGALSVGERSAPLTMLGYQGIYSPDPGVAGRGLSGLMVQGGMPEYVNTVNSRMNAMIMDSGLSYQQKQVEMVKGYMSSAYALDEMANRQFAQEKAVRYEAKQPWLPMPQAPKPIPQYRYQPSVKQEVAYAAAGPAGMAVRSVERALNAKIPNWVPYAKEIGRVQAQARSRYNQTATNLGRTAQRLWHQGSSNFIRNVNQMPLVQGIKSFLGNRQADTYKARGKEARVLANAQRGAAMIKAANSGISIGSRQVVSRGGGGGRSYRGGGVRITFNFNGGGRRYVGGGGRSNFAAYQKLFAARQAEIEAEKARRNDLNLASAQYWEGTAGIPEPQAPLANFNYHAFQRDLLNPELEGPAAYYNSLTDSGVTQRNWIKERIDFQASENDRFLKSETAEYTKALGVMQKHKNTPEGKIEIAQLSARHKAVVTQVDSKKIELRQKLADLQKEVTDTEEGLKKDISEKGQLKAKEFEFGQRLFSFQDQRDLVSAKRSHLLSRRQNRVIGAATYIKQEYALQKEGLNIEFGETELRLGRDKEELGKMAEAFAADRNVTPDESEKYHAARTAYERRVQTFERTKSESQKLLGPEAMQRDLASIYSQQVSGYTMPYISAITQGIGNGDIAGIPRRLGQVALGHIGQWANKGISNWIGNQYAQYKLGGGQGVGGFVSKMFGRGGVGGQGGPPVPSGIGNMASRLGPLGRPMFGQNLVQSLAGGKGLFGKLAGNFQKAGGFSMANIGGGILGGVGAGMLNNALYGGSTGSQVGGGIGSIAGGILGQALIPIPFLGAAIGSFAGGALGGFVGNLFGGGKQKKQEAMAKRHAYQDTKLKPFLDKLVSGADIYDLDDLAHRIVQASRGMKGRGERGMEMKREAMTRLKDMYNAVSPFESYLRYAGKFEGKQFDIQVGQNASIASVSPYQSKPYSDLFDTYSTLQSKLANTYPVFGDYTPQAQKDLNMQQFADRTAQTKSLFTKVYQNQRTQLSDQISLETEQLGFQSRNNQISALQRGINTDTMNYQFQNFDRDSRQDIEKAMGTLQRPNNRAAIVSRLQEEQAFNKNILTRQRDLLGLNNSLATDQEASSYREAQKSLQDLSASQDILDSKYQSMLSVLGDVNDEFFKLEKNIRDFNEAIRKL